MAEYKYTDLSENIFSDEENNNDFDNIISEVQNIGSNYKSNPLYLLEGLPKPSPIYTVANVLANYMPELQKMEYSPFVTPLVSAAMGIAGGKNIEDEYTLRMMDKIPFSQLSPKLANEFPALSDLPAGKAFETLKSLNNYFSLKQKQASNTFSEKDLPLIEEYLEQNNFDKNLAKYFIGKTANDLKMFKDNELAKTRLKMQERRGKVEEGHFSIGGYIPTEIIYKPYGLSPQTKPISQNKNLDDRLLKLEDIRSKINEVYDRIIELPTKEYGSLQMALESYFSKDEARSLVSNMKTLLPQIAKGYAGEVGNLSEFEQKRAEAVLPKIVPSLSEGLPDTKEALKKKKELFNEMVDIFKKLALTKGIANSLTYVYSKDKKGLFGEYEDYLKQLKDNYSDQPDVLEIINTIDKRIRGTKNKTYNVNKEQEKNNVSLLPSSVKENILKKLREKYGK